MYVRHDGTRSYFFNIEEMKELAAETGLEIENISYCERMTVNKKENVLSTKPRNSCCNFVQFRSDFIFI